LSTESHGPTLDFLDADLGNFSVQEASKMTVVPPIRYDDTQRRGFHMKERILLVGDDSNLLSTRALLLAEWQTSTTHSNEALSCVMASHYDLLVLCHSVETATVKTIVAQVRQAQTPPKILAVSHDGELDGLGIETHKRDLWESPRWLSECVTKILGNRVGA
jgi:CheY-like chemotaxis protein